MKARNQTLKEQRLVRKKQSSELVKSECVCVCARLRKNKIAEQTDGVQMQKLQRWACQLEANRKKMITE